MFICSSVVSQRNIEKDELPVETVMITFKYKNNEYRFNNAVKYYLWTLKKSTVKKIIGHVPSQDELARYTLRLNGLALDEKKTVRDLKLSDCVIDLVEQEENYVHAVDNNNEEVDNIKFEGSISIPKLLSDIFSDLKDDYFVTLKGSSIVLVKDITTSTDVTSRIMFVIHYV